MMVLESSLPRVDMTPNPVENSGVNASATAV